MKRRAKSPLSSARPRSQASDRRATKKRYNVEKIEGHRIGKKKNLELHVKWQGYDSEKDLTWEPEENLREDVPEIVDEYFRLVGGGQNTLTNVLLGENRAPKKRKKPSAATAAAHTMSGRQLENGANPAEEDSSVAAESWQPPAGSWEDEIDTIDPCEDEGGGRLTVYLIWKNGKKTRHETPVIYKKCPQKMLQFYERHVRIIKKD